MRPNKRKEEKGRTTAVSSAACSPQIGKNHGQNHHKNNNKHGKSHGYYARVALIAILVFIVILIFRLIGTGIDTFHPVIKLGKCFLHGGIILSGGKVGFHIRIEQVLNGSAGKGIFKPCPLQHIVIVFANRQQNQDAIITIFIANAPAIK